jgi:hypothetical protein
MGGANGPRECAPDDKLRDTRQLKLAKMMGFAKWLNPSCELLSRPRGSLLRRARKRNLAGPRATKQPDGQITQTLSSPFRKNISLSPSGKSSL